MGIFVKNNPATFHSDPIWNDRALWPVHTGDYSRPNSATVAKTGDCCRIRQQSPFSATNCRRNRRL